MLKGISIGVRPTGANKATRKIGGYDVRAIAWVTATIVVLIGAGTFTLRSEHFAANLARDLRHQSEMLRQGGDLPSAIAASRRAVDLYRGLTDVDPMQYEPELAVSLHELSIRLNEAGDDTGALPAIHEAVAVRRRLTGFGATEVPGLEESLQLLAKIARGRRGERPQEERSSAGAPRMTQPASDSSSRPSAPPQGDGADKATRW